MIEAEHTCMSLRGARAEGARTVTAALHGPLRDDPKTRPSSSPCTRDRGACAMSAPIVLVAAAVWPPARRFASCATRGTTATWS